MTDLGPSTALAPDDADRVLAAADLVGRTGATEFEFGWLHDGVPVADADWWAHARYRGARIHVEHHTSPAAACDALATRLLEGARCRCGRLVALSPFGAMAYSGTLVDGTRWTPTQARDAGQCLWRRQGRRWDPSCPEPADRRRT